MKKETLIDFSEKDDVMNILELLKRGGDINQYEYGRSALHSAALSNAINAVKILIDNGINLDLQDKGSGATALHYCALYNRPEITNLILQKGGRLIVADNYGNQPLWTAVFNVKGKEERLPLVELLLKFGANKNHKNLAGRSPLDFANQVGYAPLLELLGKF